MMVTEGIQGIVQLQWLSDTMIVARRATRGQVFRKETRQAGTYRGGA
jgi:hypothetical protein